MLLFFFWWFINGRTPVAFTHAYLYNTPFVYLASPYVMDFTDEYGKDLLKSKFNKTIIHVFNVVSENCHSSQV